MPLYDAAMNLHAGGLNLVPLTKNLKPTTSWSKYQNERQTDEDIKTLFSKQSVSAVAIICGKISGGVEMIDVDSKYALGDPEEFNNLIIQTLVDWLDKDLFNSLVFETTKSNGLHIYYRYKTEKYEGNQKLAERPATKEEIKNGDKGNKALIETRGEGGFSYCEPTLGYEVTKGSLQEIPTILPQQRDHIIELMKSFCQLPTKDEEYDPKTTSSARSNFKLAPWEDYNQKLDILDELTDKGWDIVKENENKIYVKRPGSDAEQSGNIFKTEKGWRLTIFSTNTPFRQRKAMSPSVAYAYLHHGELIEGDNISNALSKTAKDLKEKGYGQQWNTVEQRAFNDVIDLYQDGKTKKQIFAHIENNYVPGQIEKEVIYEKAIEATEAQKKSREGIFWDYTKTGAMKIKSSKLTKFCIEELGYRIYYPGSRDSGFYLVKLNYKNRTIERKEDQDLIAELKTVIKKWEENDTYEIDYDDLRDALEAKHQSLFKDSWFKFFIEARVVGNAHHYLSNRVIKGDAEIEVFSLLSSTVDISYVFFKNGFVEINKDGYELEPYESMPKNHFIWKNQIIDEHVSEFKKVDMTPSKVASSKWFQFLRRVSGLDEKLDKYGLKYDIKELDKKQKQRWLSTATVTGFLCHDFKNVRHQHAIVCMEDIDDQEKGGGTGKGLYFKGIDRLRTVQDIDGKTKDPTEQFVYQEVKPEATKIVLWQDIGRNFNIESIYNHITDGFNVRKLYSPQITLKFGDSPKMAITTNYTLKSNGDHADRRFKYLLFSRHFNKDHTPYDEIGDLFTSWKKDDEQWHLYYNLMFELISLHLQKGIVEVKDTENIKVKKIKTKFGDHFYDWVSFWVKDAGRNHEFETKQLYEGFKEEYSSKLGYYNFNAGLEKYCELFEVEFEWARSSSPGAEGRKVFILRDPDKPEIDQEDLPF